MRRGGPLATSQRLTHAIPTPSVVVTDAVAASRTRDISRRSAVGHATRAIPEAVAVVGGADEAHDAATASRKNANMTKTHAASGRKNSRIMPTPGFAARPPRPATSGG